MYLKTLTLRGFKSFASATTLQLEPGVTCVVGPNGSGKSNVVDALAWVMGEQGAKTLRGGAMEDVIFAGTPSRPALGRAQVTLTIDNSDGLLPIDFTEVTISRTLFRGGGSEYAINGSACRLLDVQELLSDTGLGRQMHVIVGQGQLDQVLRATPEDRRGFIEEAAGVLKHRRRKEKALRKLDSLQTNLVRLEDLVREVRRQLGPLSRQAEVARKAAVIQAELRDAQARILADDVAAVLTAQQQGAVDDAALAARRGELEQLVERLTRQVAAVEAAAQQAAPAHEAASETWYRLASLRERVAALGTLAAERVRLLAPTAPRAAEVDPEALERDAQAARTQMDELAVEREQAALALTEATESRRAAEEAERQAASVVSRLQRAAADRREGVARLGAQLEAARDRLAAAQRAEAAALAEGERTEVDLAAWQAKVAELTQVLAAAEERETDLDRAYEEARSALEETRGRHQELARSAESLDREIAALTSTVETLRRSLERSDGAGALDAAQLDGVGTTVAQLIHPKAGAADALAAALGSLADAIVVDTLPVVERAFDWLRANDAGRAGVVARDAAVVGSGEQLDKAAGRRLIDEVEAGSGMPAALLEALIGDVVLVDTATEAVATVQASPHLRAVTRDGDLISAMVSVGGGHATGSTVHLQAALADAVDRLAALQTERSAVARALEPASQQISDLTVRTDTALSALNESDARMAATTDELDRVATKVAAAQHALERSATQRGQLAATTASCEQAVADLAARLETAQADPQETSDTLAEASAAHAAAAREATRARAVETDRRLALRTIEERASAVHAQAERLAASARREREARRQADEQERQRTAARARGQAVAAGAARLTAAIDESLRRAASERHEAQQARALADEHVTAARRELDAARQELAKVADASHRDELARAELRMRLDHLEARAMEELGVTIEDLVAAYGPDQPVPVLSEESAADDQAPTTVPYVREAQEKRLRAAQRAMALLGKVNPLALEEYAALEERHRFLAKQVDDVKRSRTDLLEIVRQVDARVQEVFTQAFADTAAQFEDVFARLFPGGHGRLVLTDPDDMLTTGVEVEARPAGKRVSRLSLLSGGERSLVAIALLVSIFKARPSPFYVMDEVEAALDDVNLGRLLEIFRELQHDSQLIVITHQKRTMEIADALYGVTMRGDGVTTVISQRLRDDAEEVVALSVGD